MGVTSYINFELSGDQKANLHLVEKKLKETFSDITGLKYREGQLTIYSMQQPDEDLVIAAITGFEPEPVIYNSDEFISWAMQQVFTADLIAHMAAFLDFANKANKASKENFLAYATAVGLSDIALIIVNEATARGANLT